MATRKSMSDTPPGPSNGFSFITWLPEGEFARFREIFPVRYPATYDTWRRCTEQVIELDEASGIECVRVEVHAEGFLAWCRALGRDADGKALLDYTDRLGIAARCRHGDG